MRNQDVGINSNNQAARFAKTSSSVRQFKYDIGTRRISFTQSGSTRCLGVVTNSTTVTSQSCSTSNAQKWNIAGHRSIQNVQSGRCLMATDTGGDIRMQPCSFTDVDTSLRQHW